MKPVLWLTGIIVVTAAGMWTWLSWANTPLNGVMFAPRASTESQVAYIKEKHTYRLVRLVSASVADTYSPWAIKETNRRTFVLAAAWLVLVIAWTLFMFRGQAS